MLIDIRWIAVDICQWSWQWKRWQKVIEWRRKNAVLFCCWGGTVIITNDLEIRTYASCRQVKNIQFVLGLITNLGSALALLFHDELRHFEFLSGNHLHFCWFEGMHWDILLWTLVVHSWCIGPWPLTFLPIVFHSFLAVCRLGLQDLRCGTSIRETKAVPKETSHCFCIDIWFSKSYVRLGSKRSWRVLAEVYETSGRRPSRIPLHESYELVESLAIGPVTTFLWALPI